jgi:hypothetical protein
MKNKQGGYLKKCSKKVVTNELVNLRVRGGKG